ncbi:MAG: C_GCAxxG_C_C family protein [Nitrospirae bacterium]|nr:C_GCAxxG_C_C family protein [Nitrospirota bacterium]
MAAYGVKLGIDYGTALRLANPFGGGMGKTGETCGVVTGALMVLGLRYGTSDASDKKADGLAYESGREFIRKFMKRNASLSCRELTGFDVRTRKKLTADRDRVIFDLCPKYVLDAAEILEEML